MPDTTDCVQAAFDSVPAALYQGADGHAVRPCTPPHVTLRHLKMLDIQPGMNVLEIGTGSGYSAALIAELVGPHGEVTTIEVNRSRSERARDLYAHHGSRARAICADGLAGLSDRAPYDRIFVGATPSTIPDTWLQQLAPGGALLSGVRISQLPGAYAIAHCVVDDKHQPQATALHAGGYTPMDQPLPEGITTIETDSDPDTTMAVTGNIDDASLAAAFTALRTAPDNQPHDWTEQFLHLKNWIIAAAPEGLMAATVNSGSGVGIVLGTHAALLTDEYLVADSPESPALQHLNVLISGWRLAGHPSTSSLRCALDRTDMRWTVRATLPEQ